MFLQSASYASGHQVGYMRPEFKGNPLQIEVHNSKETGSQEPSGTDNSHKAQVPMISPIEQFPMIRNKLSSKEKVVSTVERNCHNPKVCVWQRRQRASVVGRSKSKDACVNELQLQSATVPECMDPVLDEYEPVYFNALNRHLKTVTVERTLTETEQCYSNIERELLRVCY